MALAASASDIRSALSIPDGSSSVAGPSQPKKAASTIIRKPEGISRELFSLIGSSAPTLAAHLAKPRLKQKPNFGGVGGRTKWELRPFKNSARNDGLELKHWEKVNSDPAAESIDYSFVKYNIQPTIYTYSPDEHTSYLEDEEWTKEETDYLFTLLREYDLRWYIVYDRYMFPGGPERSIEDLKDRYYSICRKLVRNRPWDGDEFSKTQVLATFQFDKERELTRKKYILSLESRTPEQIAEEEGLYIEVKRLEQNERKFKKDRENLLRTLGGMESGLPDIVEDDKSFLSSIPTEVNNSATKKKKKTGQATDIESPATPSIGSSVLRRPPVVKTSPQDILNCITRTEVGTSGIATKAAHQPVYLRSFKLPAPKAAIAPKISAALAELGVSHLRLVMPTPNTTAQLEALIDAATSLVETKRLFDKVEYDIQVLRKRLGMRDKSQSGDLIETKDAMEVDEPQVKEDAKGDAEDGDEERAQSVISIRSTRTKKHSRRSMSISSVDTISTRPNTKRQKRS